MNKNKTELLCYVIITFILLFIEIEGCNNIIINTIFNLMGFYINNLKRILKPMSSKLNLLLNNVLFFNVPHFFFFNINNY